MNTLLSASLMSGFRPLVEALGGDCRGLLDRFGIPLDIETRPDSYIPFLNTVMLFEHCAESLNCPDFGLRLSQQQGLSVLGPVAVLARNATTVEAAVRSIGDYLHLITPAVTVRFEFKPKEACIRAVFSVADIGQFQARQIYELFVGNGQLIIQMLIGAEVYASRMYFPYKRPKNSQAYQDLFRCELLFDQEHCAVDLPLDIMQQHVLGADKETARIAATYLSERYGSSLHRLSDQVVHLIRRLLPTGYCKINVIAEQLGMHPRTLQRKLNEQQAVFEKLVDEQRKTLVQDYLAETDLRLTQVAGLLGYNDQSALNRACRRWFDQTPREIRKQIGVRLSS